MISRSREGVDISVADAIAFVGNKCSDAGIVCRHILFLAKHGMLVYEKKWSGDSELAGISMNDTANQ